MAGRTYGLSNQWSVNTISLVEEVIAQLHRGLRAKIALPGERQFLHTVRGVGYTLRTEAP